MVIDEWKTNRDSMSDGKICKTVLHLDSWRFIIDICVDCQIFSHINWRGKMTITHTHTTESKIFNSVFNHKSHLTFLCLCYLHVACYISWKVCLCLCATLFSPRFTWTHTLNNLSFWYQTSSSSSGMYGWFVLKSSRERDRIFRRDTILQKRKKKKIKRELQTIIK